MQFSDYVCLELIKTGLSLSILLVTWFLGQQILSFWELRKKEKELAVARATEFHRLYGEFRTVLRLWRVVSGGGWPTGYATSFSCE
jgi:hypothetical protein